MPEVAKNLLVFSDAVLLLSDPRADESTFPGIRPAPPTRLYEPATLPRSSAYARASNASSTASRAL